MKIAMFTDYYLPTFGGVQSSIKAQKEALETLGHQVFIYSPIHRVDGDKTIVRLPTFKFFKPDGYPVAGPAKQVIASAMREVRSRGIDVIHVHTDMAAGVAGLTVAKELGIPAVQTMHGREDVFANKVPFAGLVSAVIAGLHSRYIPHDGIAIAPGENLARSGTARRMWRLMVSHANFADHVIVPSRHFADKLQHFGVNRPLSIVSNGIEASALEQLEPIRPRSYKLGQPLKIMWCGRISPEKRPIQFLKAIKAVGENVQVDMYGDGSQLGRLKRFIWENQLQNMVTLHGSVDQAAVLREMTKHDLLAYTSFDFDNQPMVLLEAVATGLPVVYCDSDLSEAIPAEGSLLTNGPGPEAIAQGVQSLID
ncbi:MAG TPA: glycosyltransferase, partial [Candidatus Polarisedimenticolaceae bacterium]|nr:glycosyltransferase [Candidatus Polarisedimenticolaceae bacterium]